MANFCTLPVTVDGKLSTKRDLVVRDPVLTGFADCLRRAHLVEKCADGLPDQGLTAVTMHIAFA
jgi:hypothetical protein